MISVRFKKYVLGDMNAPGEYHILLKGVINLNQWVEHARDVPGVGFGCG